jgi:hypothetical protein
VTNKTVALALLASGVWPLAAIATAAASTEYQGSDYSYTIGSNSRAFVCDRESDGRTAYVKGETGNGTNYRFNDLDGSFNSCWGHRDPQSSKIQWHQTCEDINNWPDACGTKDIHF